MYGIVLCVVGDPTAAAEVTERVYVELWRDCGTRSPSSSPLAALVAHAHRLAVDRVRSNGTSGSHGGRPLAGEELSRLAATQRRAIELTYFCGQSQRDAARTMEIAPEVVAEQVTAGLAQLQRDRAMAGPR
ncbi:hypothetical protein [Nocardioides zhouii]|uniref:hypothetical protein n=1 Tax=Nocardioides zhouii TaxID=1168729 RepID=UPI0013EA76B0|nr:hypothetical protein [Nocardioides zhouii]